MSSLHPNELMAPSSSSRSASTTTPSPVSALPKYRSFSTTTTMAVIMGWIIRFGSSTEPVRAFFYDYCVDREKYRSDEARGPDIHYTTWFSSQVQARANIDETREELVWWDYYGSQIRPLDCESFGLAINEAIALGQRNLPFLIRPKGSSVGKEELRASTFSPINFNNGTSSGGHPARPEKTLGVFQYTRSLRAQHASLPTTKRSALQDKCLPIPADGDAFSDISGLPIAKQSLPASTSKSQLGSHGTVSRVAKASISVKPRRNCQPVLKTLKRPQSLSPLRLPYHNPESPHLASGDNTRTRPLPSSSEDNVRSAKRSRVSQTKSLNPLKSYRPPSISLPDLKRQKLLRKDIAASWDNETAPASLPETSATTREVDAAGQGELVDFGAFGETGNSDTAVSNPELSQLLSDISRNLQCEHMTKQIYDDACALWRHNPALNDKGDLWKIPGVHGGVLPYQAVGITWALLNLSRVNGVFICDETGLGKTLELLLIFVFTIHINRCVVSCETFRTGQQTNRKHLGTDHVDALGSTTTCPSQQYWAVPCPCANEITRRISLHLGPSLVLVHNPSQLAQFRYEWDQWIDVEATCFDFLPQFFLQHGDYAKQNIPDNVFSRLRARYPGYDSQGTYSSAASSHYLVGTTARCYEAHVGRTFQTEIDFGNARSPKRIVPGIRWSAVHQDEAHKSYKTNTQNLQILRHLKRWGAPKIVCWTATPWETTLKSVTNYFNCFWDKGWKKDLQLREFTPSNLDQLDKWYQTLSSPTSAALSQKRNEIRQKLVRRWGAFCKHFIIMRTSKTIWMWHNVPITAKPPHYHKNIALNMDPKERTDALHLHKDLEREAGANRVNENGKLGGYNVTNAMIGRLHANFPLVLEHHIRKDPVGGFEFTGKEIIYNSWHQARIDWESSPYIGDIATEILSQSPKLNWLWHSFVPEVLRSRYVPKGQQDTAVEYPAKGLILTNIPATARLLYECFKREGIPCYYIAAFMSQQKRRQIIELFQEDEEGNNACFLTSTANLIGTGANLSRASYSVLFEPCWTAGEELQAYGRINRVSSPGKTQSYCLHIPGHDVEDSIRLRQKVRGEVCKDTLEVSAFGLRGDVASDEMKEPVVFLMGNGSKDAPFSLE